MICVAKISENLQKSVQTPDLCLLSILGVITPEETAEEADMEGREHGGDGARQKQGGRGGR